jgi:uncharacterized protein (PEP-CTERM system associated)
MAMATDLFLRRGRQTLLALALSVAASAHAQMPPPPPASGVSYPAPAEAGEVPPPEALPSSRRPSGRARAEIHPYLEVAQVVSADLDGGDTLTYTSVAAGIDGQIHTRRVNVAIGYRYQRNIEWQGNVGDTDIHSGVAMVNAQVIPGTLQFDAGALATRTGGEGRALGVTDRDASVEVYSAYAGPTLTTHAGPVSVNAAYRLGYVAIDDDLPGTSAADDYDSATAHSATASVGMAPGPLPVGWNVAAGYARTDNHGPFRDRSEGAFVRGDVVAPVSPTLAVTAGVGYETIEASQRDIARDATGAPVIGPNGRPVADPTRPRVLTYDLDGIIYDAGLIWRPSARTELQVRAGHRYGGTTVAGTFAHQFSPHTGMSAVVYDSVQTLGNVIVNDLSALPNDFQVDRDPLTGNLGGCVFGTEPGQGVCLSNNLQSIRSSTFRQRGASLVFTGNRGLWSWGLGAGYAHRRYERPSDPAFLILGPGSDESVTVAGSLNRRLSRTSQVGFDVYASWFDTDQADFRSVFGTGATLSYSQTLLLERLRFLAALGLYHTDDGTIDQTVLSALAGLRYTF